MKIMSVSSIPVGVSSVELNSFLCYLYTYIHIQFGVCLCVVLRRLWLLFIISVRQNSMRCVCVFECVWYGEWYNRREIEKVKVVLNWEWTNYNFIFRAYKKLFHEHIFIFFWLWCTIFWLRTYNSWKLYFLTNYYILLKTC